MRRALGLLAALLLLTGCRTLVAPAPSAGSRVDLAVHAEALDADARELSLPRSGVKLTVGHEPLVSPEHIVRVSSVPLELGRGLLLELDAEGRRRIESVPRGQRLVVIAAGQAIGQRRWHDSDRSGTLALLVELSEAELAALVGAAGDSRGRTQSR